MKNYTSEIVKMNMNRMANPMDMCMCMCFHLAFQEDVMV